MTPRTWAYGDVDRDVGAEHEDLPVRDRPYESFGRQGVALPTYGADRVATHEVEPEEQPYGDVPRGAERVDLGEPVARSLSTGPKGWQRRDDRIHDDVCAHLTLDGYVDATELEVVVHQGEVTLAGTVEDRAQRERAHRIAEMTRGVVEVINRVRIAAPAASEREPARAAEGRDDGGSRR